MIAMADMVCIFHLSDGEVWAKYLQETLQNSEKYDITAVLRHYRDIADGIQAKLNILLITPEIIETDELDLRSEYGGATCIAVLAGVDHDDWIVAKNVLRLDTELDWFIYELEAEGGSVRDLIVLIVSLYESIGRKSPMSFWSERDSPSVSSDTDNGAEDPKAKEEIKAIARPGSNGSIYKELPPTRPVQTVTHVFEKDNQIYLVLEGINDGAVEIYFRESGCKLKAARVSDKAVLYSFKHNRSDGLTFDVTLDTKEIGYGELEREIRSVSELYGEPSIRGSSLSSSSGVSSRSSPRSSVLRSSNSSSISSFSKLDQLYRLLEDVTDPVSILCQSLEVEDDVAHLDEKLSQMMESTDALGIISSQSVLDSVTDKNENRESLVSLGSLETQYHKPPPPVHPRTPPPVHPRTYSTKSVSSEEGGTQKGILKRSSQSSLKSEDGYDSVIELRTSRQRDADSISISSADSLRVTFDPRVSDVDDDRMPIPRMDDPFDKEIRYHDPETHGHTDIRTSNPIAIPKPKSDDIIAETHKKDIADYLGMHQLSSSVPSASYMHHHMKEESHGLLDRFRRKKTPPKSGFYTREEDEHRQPHSERKTKVYRHKKEHHDDRDSSPDQDQDQFRRRLQTYPLPEQIMRRPNVKKLKEKHAAAVNKLVSSAADAATIPHGGSKDDSHLPEVPLRHRESHNSKDKKDKKDRHSGKKKHNEKEHHKSKIERIIQHASKRTSMRFHMAQNDQHTSAPALPPRQPQLKNLGKF